MAWGAMGMGWTKRTTFPISEGNGEAAHVCGVCVVSRACAQNDLLEKTRSLQPMHGALPDSHACRESLHQPQESQALPSAQVHLLVTEIYRSGCLKIRVLSIIYIAMVYQIILHHLSLPFPIYINLTITKRAIMQMCYNK